MFNPRPPVLQVYIVAVQRSREKQSPGRSADLSVSSLTNDRSESGGAGLLKLVQSDLTTLSRLWLAALQDYALLTLPQEYASQLPTTGEKQEAGGDSYRSCFLQFIYLMHLNNQMKSTHFYKQSLNYPGISCIISSKSTINY